MARKDKTTSTRLFTWFMVQRKSRNSMEKILYSKRKVHDKVQYILTSVHCVFESECNDKFCVSVE